MKWEAPNPTFGRPNAVGVVPRSAHPHAALLFINLMLSPQGQQLIRHRNRVSASTAVDSYLNKFPFEMLDPVITLDEVEKRDKRKSDFFLKGRKAQRDTDQEIQVISERHFPPPTRRSR